MLVNGLARVAAISGGCRKQTETRVKEVSRVSGLWSVTGLGENCDRVVAYAKALKSMDTCHIVFDQRKTKLLSKSYQPRPLRYWYLSLNYLYTDSDSSSSLSYKPGFSLSS